ncbi:MAG: HAMP domain-containing histidine kinase [Bacteroidota bacterium]|nr:HAMP domain-containing histidine kinase [Bacteroidota bacterium]
MFSTKNLSPTQLALFTSLILSIPTSFAFYLVSFRFEVSVIALLTTFLISFFLFRFVLRWFIYRKVKLIYKFIYQTKASKREEMYYKYILPDKSIDAVEEDVAQWAQQRRDEIEVLKTNEVYRKEFLQNLSHEFKTPIFAIQGYVETLLQGASDNPAINKKFLENTARNVQRMVNLVNDLDEISRLESGAQTIIKSNFVIQDLIKEVYQLLYIVTNAKQIATTIKKGCEAPVFVFAAKEKIRQVLINLIENATKYGRQEGYITAGIYRADEDHILIEVSDNGIGIPPQHLPRVFERFYRTDLARSRNVGGTGLGLAICKHIIEAHGQVIHIRSKPDIGTTVGFTLPPKKE